MSERSRRAFRRLGRLRLSQDGTAMIELAVALPLLVFIAVGIMDYGRVYFSSIAVANAARAAAEWGAQNIATATMTTAIQDFGKLDGAEAAPITVTASPPIYKCGGTVVSFSDTCVGYGVPRVYVEVTASKVVALLIKYPGLPTSVTISRKATFRAQ
jgi:Flp pilus assembly protein TadG